MAAKVLSCGSMVNIRSVIARSDRPSSTSGFGSEANFGYVTGTEIFVTAGQHLYLVRDSLADDANCNVRYRANTGYR